MIQISLWVLIYLQHNTGALKIIDSEIGGSQLKYFNITTGHKKIP